MSLYTKPESPSNPRPDIDTSPLEPISNVSYHLNHNQPHVGDDDGDNDMTPKAEVIPLPPPLIKDSVAGNQSYQDLGVIPAHFEEFSRLRSSSQAGSESPANGVPGQKAVQHQEAILRNNFHTTKDSSGVSNYLVSSRPAPPPPQSARGHVGVSPRKSAPADTLVNGNRDKVLGSGGLGLQLEPTLGLPSNEFRHDEVKKLNELVYKMRDLSNGVTPTRPRKPSILERR